MYYCFLTITDYLLTEQIDLDDCQSVEFMEVKSKEVPRRANKNAMKSDSTQSDTSSCKIDEEEQKEANLSSIYKTPNYKNKKKSSMKYMTKHSTVNLKQHEERMKQKYGVSLSVRKDVVNKTLFRSLKRFHTESFLDKYELGKETTEAYLEKIHEYCNSSYSDKESELDYWNITLKDVEMFIAIMVSPNHIKNYIKDESEITLYKEYYSCLYQYSHKKLAKMLQNRACGFLFNTFVQDGHLTKFISNCSTMSQHSEVYHKASQGFVTSPFNYDLKNDDEISFNHFN